MSANADHHSVCCIGYMSMDRVLDLQQPGVTGTTNAVSSRPRRGGTARNVAENLARLSVPCTLMSLVGNDEAGQTVLSETAQLNVETSLVQKSLKLPTASRILAMQPDGELFVGFADMTICTAMSRAFIQSRWLQILNATLVFADASLPADSIAYLIAGCRENGLELVLDAVSIASARKLPLNLNGVDTLICNTDEARAILGDDISKDIEGMAAALCQRGTRSSVVTAGPDGICYANADGVLRYPAFPGDVVDVSGAGDALNAGMLYGRLLGYDTATTLKAGLTAAAMTLACRESHCPDLSPESMTAALSAGEREVKAPR